MDLQIGSIQLQCCEIGGQFFCEIISQIFIQI